MMALLNGAYQFSLLTWSPYPGVSTMLSLSLTPLSTMAIKSEQSAKKATVRVCIKYVAGCATRQLKPFHEDGESADIRTGIDTFFSLFCLIFFSSKRL